VVNPTRVAFLFPFRRDGAIYTEVWRAINRFLTVF